MTPFEYVSGFELKKLAALAMCLGGADDIGAILRGEKEVVVQPNVLGINFLQPLGDQEKLEYAMKAISPFTVGQLTALTFKVGPDAVLVVYGTKQAVVLPVFKEVDSFEVSVDATVGVEELTRGYFTQVDPRINNVNFPLPAHGTLSKQTFRVLQFAGQVFYNEAAVAIAKKGYVPCDIWDLTPCARDYDNPVLRLPLIGLASRWNNLVPVVTVDNGGTNLVLHPTDLPVPAYYKFLVSKS
ncbi:MAG: hypothetical protein NTY04_00060 [Candidatus Staskawiczbacteria bacterium]|nr:hypothetical protein [Candidatus Staskawiczbacteria bacterium]